MLSSCLLNFVLLILQSSSSFSTSIEGSINSFEAKYASESQVSDLEPQISNKIAINENSLEPSHAGLLSQDERMINLVPATDESRERVSDFKHSFGESRDQSRSKKIEVFRNREREDENQESIPEHGEKYNPKSDSERIGHFRDSLLSAQQTAHSDTGSQKTKYLDMAARTEESARRKYVGVSKMQRNGEEQSIEKPGGINEDEKSGQLGSRVAHTANGPREESEGLSQPFTEMEKTSTGYNQLQQNEGAGESDKDKRWPGGLDQQLPDKSRQQKEADQLSNGRPVVESFSNTDFGRQVGDGVQDARNKRQGFQSDRQRTGNDPSYKIADSEQRRGAADSWPGGEGFHDVDKGHQGVKPVAEETAGEGQKHTGSPGFSREGALVQDSDKLNKLGGQQSDDGPAQLVRGKPQLVEETLDAPSVSGNGHKESGRVHSGDDGPGSGIEGRKPGEWAAVEEKGSARADQPEGAGARQQDGLESESVRGAWRGVDGRSDEPEQRVDARVRSPADSAVGGSHDGRDMLHNVDVGRHSAVRPARDGFRSSDVEDGRRDVEGHEGRSEPGSAGGARWEAGGLDERGRLVGGDLHRDSERVAPERGQRAPDKGDRSLSGGRQVSPDAADAGDGWPGRGGVVGVDDGGGAERRGGQGLQRPDAARPADALRDGRGPLPRDPEGPERAGGQRGFDDSDRRRAADGRAHHSAAERRPTAPGLSPACRGTKRPGPWGPCCGQRRRRCR